MTTSLTTLALERSAQPPTATCPSSFQGCLLWAALRQVEQRIAANHLAVRELAIAAGQSSYIWAEDSAVVLTEREKCPAQDLR